MRSLKRKSFGNMSVAVLLMHALFSASLGEPKLGRRSTKEKQALSCFLSVAVFLASAALFNVAFRFNNRNCQPFTCDHVIIRCHQRYSLADTQQALNHNFAA